MQQYETYMKKCFELALKGEGNTSPNPMVGCVVLDKNNNIVSEGFHKKCGENHAERDALLKIKPENCEGGTLVVNLEPCSHYGKTPPCADLIIEYGIKKVVVGMRDVNPIVAGNGIKKLKNAGIDVVEGVLEEEASRLNEVFITNMTEHRTFVALKTAATLDGKIATRTGDSKWITSDTARQEVKNIRRRYDAILTSSSTIIADNPTMQHKNKIILDRTLKTDFKNANIYKSGNIYVFHDKTLTAPKISGIEFIPTQVNKEKLDIEFILKKAYDLGIMSVLCECGGVLNGSLIDYTDKVYHFIAPKILSDNTGKSAFDGKNIEFIKDTANFFFSEIKTFEPDIMLTYYRLK